MRGWMKYIRGGRRVTSQSPTIEHDEWVKVVEQNGGRPVCRYCGEMAGPHEGTVVHRRNCPQKRLTVSAWPVSGGRPESKRDEF